MFLSKKSIRLWKKELDEAIRKQDVNEWLKFYDKWHYLGVYETPMPNNPKMIEIMLKKLLYQMPSATDQERREAKKWLESHGCSTSLNETGKRS